MKKYLYILMSAALIVISAGCSSDGDDEAFYVDSPNVFYAIIKPEGAQLIDITPNDYVLTLDNIIAVNPETGEFKVKDTERIDSKAFPNYLIQFYSEGTLLFEAKLNSAFSSYLPDGLTFCHFLSDENGLARYDLRITHITNSDGEVIGGELTKQQQQGMQRMYEILQKAGKTSSNIDYDFYFTHRS